jgi:hypothetical protein
LQEWQEKTTIYLAENLRLIPHPDKTKIFLVKKGVPFLGFRVWPAYRVVKKESTRRYERFLHQKIRKKVDLNQIEAGLNSWLGHIRFGQSQRLEYRVFWRLRHQGIHVLKHPNGSWRFLGGAALSSVFAVYPLHCT